MGIGQCDVTPAAGNRAAGAECGRTGSRGDGNRSVGAGDGCIDGYSVVAIVQRKAAWRSDRIELGDVVGHRVQVQGAACACQRGAQLRCVDRPRLRDRAAGCQGDVAASARAVVDARDCEPGGVGVADGCVSVGWSYGCDRAVASLQVDRGRIITCVAQSDGGTRSSCSSGRQRGCLDGPRLRQRAACQQGDVTASARAVVDARNAHCVGIGVADGSIGVGCSYGCDRAGTGLQVDCFCIVVLCGQGDRCPSILGCCCAQMASHNVARLRDGIARQNRHITTLHTAGAIARKNAPQSQRPCGGDVDLASIAVDVAFGQERAKGGSREGCCVIVDGDAASG